MAKNQHRNNFSSASFQTLAQRSAKRALALITVFTFSTLCLAQDEAPPNPPQQNQTQEAPTQPKPPSETIPPATSFALVLTSSVSSKTTHRGDQIQAQTTAPVTLGDHVVIPAGVFVQGKVDKLRRDGTRAEMQMQAGSLIFPDGYVANIPGRLTIESDEGTAWLNPSTGAKAAMFIAPAAGLGIGAAAGAAAHTTQSVSAGGNTLTQSSPKGIAIGSLVGLAAGGAVALVVLARSHGFFVEQGSPMQMTLSQPLIVSQIPSAGDNRVAQDIPPTH